jgi:branched-subunit amino acid transport protein
MWTVVVLAGIGTFAMRFSFIALFGRVSVPPTVERALKYVAPSVLAAITLPALLAPGGTFDPLNAFVPAAILGGLAAWKTRSIGAAIVVGLPSLWILQWLFG